MVEDWTRLGRAVRGRREGMRMTQTEAASRTGGAVSVSLWRNVEKAFRPPFRLPGLLAMCEVLRWAPESVDLVLKGGEPVELPPEPVGEDADLADQLADLRRQFADFVAKWEPYLVHLKGETDLALAEWGVRLEEIKAGIRKPARSGEEAEAPRRVRRGA